MTDNMKNKVFLVDKTFVKENMLDLSDASLKVYLYAKCLADENGGEVACDALYEIFGGKVFVQEALRDLVRRGCLLVSKNSIVTFALQNDKPKYNNVEVSQSVRSDTQLQMLMQAAEQVLGKMLTASAAETLYGIYDWLGMPVEVILKLLEYCVGIGKKSMAYIEKVAITWQKEGIVTLQAAQEHVENENKKRSYAYKAKRIFGIENRNLTSKEEEFVRRWMAMGVSEALLAFAFDYTVDNTGKLALAYMDKVLCAWVQSGVKTPQQAQQYMEEYKKENVPVKKERSGISTKGKPSVFSGDKYDYDEIRRKAREKIRRKIGKE